MAKRESKKLENLFHDTLKDIYFAEKKILATLPKMEKAAQSAELKTAFAKHRKETEGQWRASKKSSPPSTRGRRAKRVTPSSALPMKARKL
jgi:ferritin-like metal-binding protein YciE